ncbi:MAG: sigma-70 family RNA polymerase sigma factor [Bacteroidota bacterium]
MNDESWVLKAILDGDKKNRKNAITYLYDKCYPSFSRLVLKTGSKEQAEDLFQEGLAVMYNNIINEVFRGDSKVSTYLISICKNLWLMELRSQKNALDVEELAVSVESEELEVDITSLKVLQQLLNTDCQKILKAFYYENLSMKEIQNQFDLGSSQAAKNKKMRCLKKLMTFIKDKGLTYDNFLK